eukprot:snap_masked-scaffold_4-processed-gene-9.22-mRNA-1 protein AED:0.36 eAED:0.37 QI:0/-1/0/1/-1/1/1/0/282
MSAHFHDVVEQVKYRFHKGNPRLLNSDILLLPITISFCTFSETKLNYGLGSDCSEKILKVLDGNTKKLLMISKRDASHEVFSKLQQSDVILEVEGRITTGVRTFFNRTADRIPVDLKVLREGKVINVNVKTAAFSTRGVKRIIQFCGMIVQEIPESIKYLCKPEIFPASGVFVSYNYGGYPVEVAKEKAAHNNYTSFTTLDNRIVTKVGKKTIKNLDDFTSALMEYTDKQYVRIEAKAMETGETSKHFLQLDLKYWSTRNIFRNENEEWEVSTIYHESRDEA